MHTTSILVLGAGELGLAVLRGLAAHVARFSDPSAPTITVLLRPAALASPDPVKQRDLAELRALGVQFLPGNLAGSATELAALFAGFDTVIGCTGFVTGRGFQLTLARAVLAAGVARYLPWQFGVDYDLIGRGSAQDLWDEQLDVRDLLRGQTRTEWVIVSTGMFTSFLFEPTFGVVDLAHDTVHALGDWDTRVTVTTPEDIGQLTAAICFAEPRIVNRVVYTAGDTLTYGQVADLVEAELGRPVRRVVWSVAALQDELSRDPTNALKKYRVVFAQGKGVAWNMRDTFNAQHEIETVNVAQWARKHLR